MEARQVQVTDSQSLNNIGTAKARYDLLKQEREPYLERARECSKLTLPYLIPPDDMANGSTLPSLYQSVGANGTTNLASKLLMSMLPPNQPCFRFKVNNYNFEEELSKEDKEVRTKVDKELAGIEQAILDDIEATADRPIVHEGNLHLIIGGNVLYYNDEKKGLRMFPLSRFVVRRDPMGAQVEIIIYETVDPSTLDTDFLESIRDVKEVFDKTKGKTDSDLEIYTHLTRSNDVWNIYQECCGKVIPNSIGTYKLEACPFFAVRMYTIAGEHYGRSFVEQQLGNLNTLESLSQAITDGSIVSAKIVGLVTPNGYTNPRKLAEAKNGDIIEGNASDVSFMQVQKGADLQVPAQRIAVLEQDLKTAFLMMNGLQRQAERVTAEEVRMIAQELETGLGGVYTIIGEEFQLPYIRSRMEQMSKAKRIPKLPKEAVSPTIVTGFEAIGRGNDKVKLIEFLQTCRELFGDAFMKLLHTNDAVLRLANAIGIKTDGLVKTTDELKQEAQAEQEAQAKMAQQQQGADLMNKVSPEIIKQVGSQMGADPQ